MGKVGRVIDPWYSGTYIGLIELTGSNVRATAQALIQPEGTVEEVVAKWRDFTILRLGTYMTQTGHPLLVLSCAPLVTALLRTKLVLTAMVVIVIII